MTRTSSSSIGVILLLSLLAPPSVYAKDSVKTDPVQSQQDEIRKSRLKQQGQGEQYRVEGKKQGGSRGPISPAAKGHDRENTGIEDPTVNPGQAAGLKTLHGHVLKSEETALTVKQEDGQETVLMVDPQTAFNTNIRPGDRITGTVTNQNRAVLVHKEEEPQP